MLYQIWRKPVHGPCPWELFTEWGSERGAKRTLFTKKEIDYFFKEWAHRTPRFKYEARPVDAVKDGLGGILR